MKTLSRWCFLSLCQFDLKCSGQVVFLSVISYRGTQFSHIFLIASLETPPSRFCLFSVLRWAETPAAVSLLLLPAQVITQKALTEHLKWEFRLQLSIRAVALLRVTVAFVCSFFYLSRPLEQKAAAVKGGLIRVKTRPAEEWRQSVLSLSTDMYEILLQAVHPDFQVIPSKGKKEGDFS